MSDIKEVQNPDKIIDGPFLDPNWSFPEQVELLSNCYPINVKESKSLNHYKFEVLHFNDGKRHVINKKLALRNMFWKLVKDNQDIFGGKANQIVYDDDSNVFSVEPFALETKDDRLVNSFTIQKNFANEMRAVITFNEKITIEPGQKLKEIEKQLLQTILTTHLRMPKRTSEDISWYGMDTVYIHRPFGLYQKNYVEVGDKHNIYLNESLGLALKQSKENKLVVVANNMNKVTKGIPCNLIDLFVTKADPSQSLDESLAFKDEAKTLFDTFMMGVRVSTTYDNTEYLFQGIHRSDAVTESFFFKGKPITVKDYYKDVKDIELKYPNVLLAKLKSLFNYKNLCFIPMELLKVATRPSNVQFTEEILKAHKSVEPNPTPEETFTIISGLANVSEIKKENEQKKAFGIEIENLDEAKMVRVSGKILPPLESSFSLSHTLRPSINGDDIVFHPFFLGTPTEDVEFALDNFLFNLDSYKKQKFVIQPLFFFSDYQQLLWKVDKKILESQTALKNNFFFCVMEKNSEDLQKELTKRSLIVPSESILIATLAELAKGVDKASTQDGVIFQNLISKFEQKLCGLNHVIVSEKPKNDAAIYSNETFGWLASQNTMFLGITSHKPGRQDAKDVPSVLTITFNVDSRASHYSGVFAFEEGKKETFEHFNDVFATCLDRFVEDRKSPPAYIVVLRDSVFRTKTDSVAKSEVESIQDQCGGYALAHDKLEWKPKILYLNVTKNPSLRFCQSGLRNPSPGTVIEQSVVEDENEFFLYGPHNDSGTITPLSIKVLHNSFPASFTLEMIQITVYGLTHIVKHGNTNLPAPLFAADLVKTCCLKKIQSVESEGNYKLEISGDDANIGMFQD